MTEPTGAHGGADRAPALPPLTVHGTGVAYRDRGALIMGAAGSGKSMLATEMIALGADLIADDRVQIARADEGGLVMRPPAPTAGLIELRGLGLVRLPHLDQAPLLFIADLDTEPPGRLPQPRKRILLGTACPVISCKGRPVLAAGLIALLMAGGLVDPEAPWA